MEQMTHVNQLWDDTADRMADVVENAQYRRYNRTPEDRSAKYDFSREEYATGGTYAGLIHTILSAFDVEVYREYILPYSQQ
jgi:hypothetical protein